MAKEHKANKKRMLEIRHYFAWKLNNKMFTIKLWLISYTSQKALFVKHERVVRIGEVWYYVCFYFRGFKNKWNMQKMETKVYENYLQSLPLDADISQENLQF